MKRLLPFVLLFCSLTQLSAITTPNPVYVGPNGKDTYSVTFSGWSGGYPNYPYVEVYLLKWDDINESYVNYDSMGAWPSQFGLWSFVMYGVPKGYYCAMYGEIIDDEWVFSDMQEFSVGIVLNPPMKD